jgi:hypothetical protein
MWPSEPKTFQAFWGKVESCGLLKLLCETAEYEEKWKDPLLYHLGQLWIAGPVPGRLEPENGQMARSPGGTMWSITVLDLILQGLIATGTAMRNVKHAEVSHQLLQHFFPQDFIANLSLPDFCDRIASVGRIHEDQFLDVLCGASACRTQIDGRSA